MRWIRESGPSSHLTFFSEADCLSGVAVGWRPPGGPLPGPSWSDSTVVPAPGPVDQPDPDQEKNRKKRRNSGLRKAQARMRQKIINLVDELHWQCARWLTSNYRVILLPKFETQSMTRRGERQIQSKISRTDQPEEAVTCAKLRRGCARRSSTWSMSSTGSAPAG